MKKICFNLKGEWYRRIASGDPEPETGKPKLIEYRKPSAFWWSRVRPFYRYGMPDDLYAVFRYGYGNAKPLLIRRIVGIDIGPCPYKGWRGNFIRFHFEPNGEVCL